MCAAHHRPPRRHDGQGKGERGCEDKEEEEERGCEDEEEEVEVEVEEEEVEEEDDGLTGWNALNSLMSTTVPGSMCPTIARLRPLTSSHRSFPLACNRLIRPSGRKKDFVTPTGRLRQHDRSCHTARQRRKDRTRNPIWIPRRDSKEMANRVGSKGRAPSIEREQEGARYAQHAVWDRLDLRREHDRRTVVPPLEEEQAVRRDVVVPDAVHPAGIRVHHLDLTKDQELAEQHSASVGP